ncbi:MAG: TetR family transcriptional regulator [Myxococcales bacterium]|nr:TetR family transcriptional regulator [Myxococcales bacterium]|tara:strand:- start:40 stop:726 length:687 start_codon:yes stop_codon:yes gene_type:complete
MSNKNLQNNETSGKGAPKTRPGQPGGVRARNREERIRNLSKAALELFLARGIEPVTIDEIVDHCGVAKGTFYRYFDDKTHLVKVLLDPVEDAMKQALETCRNAVAQARDRAALIQAYQNLALVLSQLILENSDVACMYLQENRSPAVGAREPICALSAVVLEESISLTRTAQEHGLQRAMEPSISARAVVGATESLILASLNQSLTLPPVQVYATLITLVVDGIKAEN